MLYGPPADRSRLRLRPVCRLLCGFGDCAGAFFALGGPLLALSLRKRKNGGKEGREEVKREGREIPFAGRDHPFLCPSEELPL